MKQNINNDSTESFITLEYKINKPHFATHFCLQMNHQLSPQLNYNQEVFEVLQYTLLLQTVVTTRWWYKGSLPTEDVHQSVEHSNW